MAAVRSFFSSAGFLEVETPTCVRAPLPERHIDAIPCGTHWLATSPEPHMKRLLAAGCPRIFQISKCFRAGEQGRHHHPEFSMLEWYRAHDGMAALIDDAKALLAHVGRSVHGADTFTFRGQSINLGGSWNMLSVDDAFLQYANWKLETCPDAAAFDTALVEKVEPRLGHGVPTVLHGYPACFSPMALPQASRPGRADRFEIYIAGVELANGCAELVNRAALEANLHAERTARTAMGKDPYPWPEEFVAALDHMPPSAGTALGLDRLVMLLCDAQKIEDVVAFAE
jgi:lysyl-tRNA synthetase class 2